MMPMGLRSAVLRAAGSSAITVIHRFLLLYCERGRTLSGLLTNYFSFAPLSFKLGLVRTSVDRVYKIKNSWLGFHGDIKLMMILR